MLTTSGLNHMPIMQSNFTKTNQKNISNCDARAQCAGHGSVFAYIYI